MNQIPSKGEECGECPLLEKSFFGRRYCQLYPKRSWETYKRMLYRLLGMKSAKRLPECLDQKPQIMTQEDRVEMIEDYLATVNISG